MSRKINKKQTIKLLPVFHFPMMKYPMRACHLLGKAGFHDGCFTGCISTHKSLLVSQHWGAVRPHDCISPCCNAASDSAAYAGTKQQISHRLIKPKLAFVCASPSAQCLYICITAQNFIWRTSLKSVSTLLIFLFVDLLRRVPREVLYPRRVFDILLRKCADETDETFSGRDESCLRPACLVSFTPRAWMARLDAEEGGSSHVTEGFA